MSNGTDTSGLQLRKRPASLLDPSATPGWCAGAGGGIVHGAGRSKGRELLLDPFPSALRALRFRLAACQNEFFEHVVAIGTGIFKDRHTNRSLFQFDVTAFFFPRRGSPTPRSGKAGDSGDPGQDHEPDH